MQPLLHPPPPPPTFKYYERHSRGARPKALGHPVIQNLGRTDRHCLEPTRDKRIVKVHCGLVKFHCNQKNRQNWHQAELESRQGKERLKERNNGWEEG